MAQGKKTGGRQEGTPNKERKTLIEMLTEKYPEYNPVIALADIANDKKNDINLRFQANKEVAKYVCPQLKSVELTTVNQNEINKALPPEQLHELISSINKANEPNKFTVVIVPPLLE